MKRFPWASLVFYVPLVTMLIAVGIAAYNQPVPPVARQTVAAPLPKPVVKPLVILMLGAEPVQSHPHEFSRGKNP